MLETDEDVAAVAQCTAIGGSLTIRGEGVNSVDLPLLESVALGLTVESSALRELELPALELVGGALYVIHNQLLERIALPALTRSRGGIGISGSTLGTDDDQHSLTAIELPALVEIGDGLEESGVPASLGIGGNGVLSVIRLPALARIKTNFAIVNSAALATIELPALQSIGEEVNIDSNEVLTAVRVPALRECGGRIFRIEGKSLTELDLPVLRHAGIIIIASDAELDSVELPLLENAESLRIGPTTATRIALPMLSWVYATLVIQDNARLTSLELPLLHDIGEDWVDPSESNIGILLENNAQLASADFPALKLVGDDLLVHGNPMLTSLNLSTLEEVGNELEIRGTALTALSAPALASIGRNAVNRLVFGALTVADNPSLQSLALPLLTTVGLDFRITNNALLPTCDVQALAAQLITPAANSVVVDGNAGTCP